MRKTLKVVPLLLEAQKALQSFFDLFLLKNRLPLPTLLAPYIIALVLAAFGVCLQLAVQIVAIRRNLLQVYRGDDSELPHRSKLDNVSTAMGNFHFAGR
ncbi:unnamed protein product [Didymodactylos carnosus]|uniref:Uncharacterized protein n=1 Tax=Didymodactylos carnosus TaxID=1234261 RepID=A0A815RMF0_9BILA|nr:unnamed protein product [Didymodactylos carnosus]CAF1479565.1 unnamed protein product [Didymodactylos carnosus]CAF3748193.1 unnamed protein product [Didymodactylos carnosus]CAF4344920.1 unnamed protein product [Didymodactylos carnosus]